MKTIFFNPDGGEIKVNLEFTGLITAVFHFNLYEANSNMSILHEKNDNKETSKFTFSLPLPAGENNNRLIEINSAIIGLDPPNSRQYFIRVEVIQDGSLSGEVEAAGEVSGLMQKDDIYIKLESKKI